MNDKFKIPWLTIHGATLTTFLVYKQQVDRASIDYYLNNGTYIQLSNLNAVTSLSLIEDVLCDILSLH
jgi:hypothetical protein